MTIWAITLITTIFKILLIFIAKFDFEILQMNVVNIFVYVNLNEIMYMKMLFEYKKQGKVLLLNKTLYELKRFSIFWQKKFANEFKKFEFDFILQESCIVFRNDIICFFFVDDIVWTFRKNRRNEVMSVIQILFKIFTIEILEKLKWFFEMYIIRNCIKEFLWIFQNAYIEKICEVLMFIIFRFSFTFMKIIKLQPMTNDEKISNNSRILYQKKVEFILFAIIFIRPNVAFVIFKYVQFNQMLNWKHYYVANRVIQYLYNIQIYCICYEKYQISSTNWYHLFVLTMFFLLTILLIEKIHKGISWNYSTNLFHEEQINKISLLFHSRRPSFWLFFKQSKKSFIYFVWWNPWRWSFRNRWL